jgi:Gpi18-like mannosyltransferase
MRAVTPLVRDAAVAGILVNNLALLLAMILFYRLVAESYGETVADRAVWYLLIFPTAFFGTAVYSESLFLLSAIGAWYFARHGRWGAAAIFAAAAGLTRLVGVIVVPLLLGEWWQQMRGDGEGKRPSLLTLPAVFAPLAGTGMFMAYLWHIFGDPLAFVHGAAAWERQPQSVFLTLAELLQKPVGGWGTAVLAGDIHIDNWLDFSMALLFLALGIVLLNKKRWGEAVFVLLGVLIPFNSGLLMSMRRYVWVLFPAFILLAQWGKRPAIDKTITTFSLLGLALFTALFANGYWVG